MGVQSTVSGSDGLGFVGDYPIAGVAEGSLQNQIYGNTTGIVLVNANVQAQWVHDNTTGISGTGTVGGSDFDYANLIDSNTTGVNTTGVIQFSRITGNVTGILASSGQLIAHNMIYRNTQTAIEIKGKTNVEIVSNTFYAPQGDNIRIEGGSSDVEVRDDILWAESGYDIYVANDSQSGFFSDYNDIYVTGTGKIGYWTKDFYDILDWQDDIDLFDLHSIGATVVNPSWAEPQFYNAARDDYRVFPETEGQRFSSPTVNAADPLTDLAIPSSYVNLLTNGDFDSGLTGWTTSVGATTQSASPAPFSGTSYFWGDTDASAYAQQTINLAADGYTAAQVDSGNFVIEFGGRVRSAAASTPDEGQIEVLFLDGSGNTIKDVVVPADNTTDRWELIGERMALPTGTRSVRFRFEGTRESGSTNDSYFDHAFVYMVPEAQMPGQGAYGNTYAETASTAPSLALRFPDLYTDWEKERPHDITWDSFNNSSNSAVRIDLYQDGPTGTVLLKTIAASAPDTGSYIWIPANSGIDFDTKGLRIQISLVNNPGVMDRSQETFAVPENGNTYYVNDGSTVGDQFTTAIGSNRNTGKSPASPKPNPINVFRTYQIGAGDTIDVDTGTYPLISPILVSGSTDFGLGRHEGFTLQGPTDTTETAVFTPAIPGSQPAALIELNDASYVTLRNLTLVGGQRGLYVHNSSTNFHADYITSYDDSADAIHIETTSPNSVYSHLVAYDASGGSGIYIVGAIGGVTDSLSYDNQNYGIYLSGTGNAVLEASEFYGNQTGIYATNISSGTTLTIGSTNLSLA